MDFQIENGVLVKYEGLEENVVIPEGVTAIGDGVFQECKTMSSVVLPEGVTSIGDSAFAYCTRLRSVSIPASVNTIGNYAFTGCDKLEEITIPTGVKRIAEWTFWGCGSLTHVRLPDGITCIESNAFCHCKKLENVVIPDSVTEIGDNAFCNCQSITTIELPDSVNALDEGAFGDCIGLTEVRIPAGVTRIEKGLFYDCKGLKHVMIPDHVTSIGGYAYKGCSNLQYVSLPGEIESIEEDSFGDANRIEWVVRGTMGEALKKYMQEQKVLAKVQMPEALCSQIPSAARVGNVLLTARRLEAGETVAPEIYASYVKYLKSNRAKWLEEYKKENVPVLNWMMREKLIPVEDIDTLINRIMQADDPELLNRLMAYQSENFNASDYDKYMDREFRKVQRDAEERKNPGTQEYIDRMWTVGRQEACVKSFKDTGKIVEFPVLVGGVTVTGIADRFEFKSTGDNSRELVEEVVIPEGYTTIGNGAFAGCTKLKSISLPQSLICIGKRAFKDCKRLKSLTIPKGLKTIGEDAFDECSGLKEVRYSDVGAWALLDKSDWADNYYFFKALKIGEGDGQDLVIPDGVTHIADHAFRRCGMIKSIRIPDSINCIGKGAFSWCEKLESVDIPKGVSMVDECAFEFCSKMKSITIPEGITRIGSNVFWGCEKLSNVLFEGDLVSWLNIDMPDGDLQGAALFIKGEPVQDLIIPEGMTGIRAGAFYGCGSLTSLSIPEGVTVIGSAAFLGCSKLKSVCLPNSIRTIAERSFGYCTALKKIDLPESVDSIGELAFFNSGIKQLIIRNPDVDLTDTDCLEDCKNYTIYAPERSVVSRYAPKYTKALSEYSSKGKPSRVAKGPLTGLTFVVTGDINTWQSRDDLRVIVQEYGGKLAESITGKTDYLIANDLTTGSSKLQKAQQLGIKIIDESAFLKMIGL